MMNGMESSGGNSGLLYLILPYNFLLEVLQGPAVARLSCPSSRLRGELQREPSNAVTYMKQIEISNVPLSLLLSDDMRCPLRAQRRTPLSYLDPSMPLSPALTSPSDQVPAESSPKGRNESWDLRERSLIGRDPCHRDSEPLEKGTRSTAAQG